MLTYRRIELCSFVHSAIYLGLLLAWAIPGLAGPTFVLGMAHGLGWFVMVALSLVAVRRRVIPFWLGVTVAVVGAIGPFAGSIGFVLHDRRRRAATDGLAAA